MTFSPLKLVHHTYITPCKTLGAFAPTIGLRPGPRCEGGEGRGRKIKEKKLKCDLTDTPVSLKKAGGGAGLWSML